LEPPIDFAGWSYGAEITLDFALDNPQWVRSLALIEPPAFWVLPARGEDPEDAQDGERPSREDVTEGQLIAFLRESGLVPSGTDPRGLPQWPVWDRHRQSLRAEPYIQEYAADPGRLSSFTPPVLLVKGTGSTPLMHEIVDELARRLPHAQVAEFPGGHAPHIVSMAPFLQRLAAFHAEAG
jgi:pimeloyl-ACP methyl ester carboxylesterase